MDPPTDVCGRAADVYILSEDEDTNDDEINQSSRYYGGGKDLFALHYEPVEGEPVEASDPYGSGRAKGLMVAPGARAMGAKALVTMPPGDMVGMVTSVVEGNVAVGRHRSPEEIEDRMERVVAGNPKQVVEFVKEKVQSSRARAKAIATNGAACYYRLVQGEECDVTGLTSLLDSVEIDDELRAFGDAIGELVEMVDPASDPTCEDKLRGDDGSSMASGTFLESPLVQDGRALTPAQLTIRIQERLERSVAKDPRTDVPLPSDELFVVGPAADPMAIAGWETLGMYYMMNEAPRIFRDLSSYEMRRVNDYINLTMLEDEEEEDVAEDQDHRSKKRRPASRMKEERAFRLKIGRLLRIVMMTAYPPPSSTFSEPPQKMVLPHLRGPEHVRKFKAEVRKAPLTKAAAEKAAEDRAAAEKARAETAVLEAALSRGIDTKTSCGQETFLKAGKGKKKPSDAKVDLTALLRSYPGIKQEIIRLASALGKELVQCESKGKDKVKSVLDVRGWNEREREVLIDTVESFTFFVPGMILPTDEQVRSLLQKSPLPPSVQDILTRYYPVENPVNPKRYTTALKWELQHLCFDF